MSTGFVWLVESAESCGYRVRGTVDVKYPVKSIISEVLMLHRRNPTAVVEQLRFTLL